MRGDKSDYVGYRMQRSYDTLREAELLLSGGLTAGAVNRIYYACFYSVSALLASEGHSSARHSGVMSLFDQHWIKPGRMPKEIGAFYHLIFQHRLKGDYENDIVFEQGRVKEWLDEAQALVAQAADWLQSSKGIAV